MSKALAALALCLCAALPDGASAAAGYVLRKVALEGEAAPGTSDTFLEVSAVAMNASGQVAFLASLSSGPPASGAWVETNGALALRMRNGDPAPMAGGTYAMMAGFPELDQAGNLVVLAPISGGTSPRGLFLDAGGSDSALLLSGAAAPLAVGGTLSAGLADLQPFGFSANGVLAFRSAVTGGSSSSGLFRRDSGGSLTVLTLAGDSAPGTGGATYTAFTHPALDAAARIAFSASLTGPAARGLFANTGAGLYALALSGNAAPGTGGGAFTDFLYPSSANGAVAFLAAVSGGAATGGVFLSNGSLVAVAVENQLAPGTGGATLASVNAPPAIDGDRSVAFSAGLSGGSSSGGLFVYDADTAALAPAALEGDTVPGVSSPLASFEHVATGSGGALAFVAELADGRSGVFVATPTAAVIPAMPAAFGVGLAVALAALARAGLRLAARSRT